MNDDEKKYLTRNPLKKRMIDNYMRDLVMFPDTPKTVLDFGCGKGFLTESIAKRYNNAQITAIDPDKTAIGFAQSHRTSNRITYKVGNKITGMYELGFCCEVLEHTSEYKDIMKRLLNHCDVCIFTVPNEPMFSIFRALSRHDSNELGHVNHWSSRQFKAICQQLGNTVLRKSGVWTIARVKQ